MKQCDNGHFYDENRFDSCPYCQEGAGVGKTVSAGSVGKTVAAVSRSATPEADRGKTVGIIKKKIGIDPAVGFLVCISGPHRGADYKLVSGRNFIGRAAAMDVALADDDTCSIPRCGKPPRPPRRADNAFPLRRSRPGAAVPADTARLPSGLPRTHNGSSPLVGAASPFPGKGG